jgi:hypothetical protein
VCLTDVNIIICFTVTLLRKLESNILMCDEDELNTLLKFNLKTLIDGLNRQTLLEESVNLYLSNFLNPPTQLSDIDIMEMDEDIIHNPTIPISARIN